MTKSHTVLIVLEAMYDKESQLKQTLPMLKTKVPKNPFV